MKKILLFIIALFIINPVMAKSVKVEALENFSTAKPPKYWSIKIIEGFIADNGIYIKPNTIVKGEITKTVGPKRLKRNAVFCFVPKTYYDPQDGEGKLVKREFEGKYSSKTNLTVKNVAKKGAITAGNMLIGSFVAPAVGLVEGAVKNNEGNRAKSAVVSAYESTPLSYVSKGKDLEFQKGQIFVMNFKLKGEDDLEEDLPNYTYEITND